MLCAATHPSNCRRDLRVTHAILSEIPGINVAGTIAFFKKHGGYCDCEVVSNAMRHLERQYLDTDDLEFYERVIGEKFDPNSPKWKEYFGQYQFLCNDCHEKEHASKNAGN